MFKIESEENNLKKLNITKISDLNNKFNIDDIVCSHSISFDGECKLIPEINIHYQFVPEITQSILVALNNNKKMLLYGIHGSGKSSHIEQVAAKLSWPVIRLNLDNEIGRVELIGKDKLINKDGKTEMVFEPGILTFAITHPVILILDEYDAATPEALFIIQQLLEKNGKLIIPETSQVINTHTHFRLFATANTIGIGDELGLYQGTNLLNQGQLDRWQIIEKLDYLDVTQEKLLLHKMLPTICNDTVKSLLLLAELVRNSFKEGSISLTLSTRMLLNIAENYLIFDDLAKSLKVSFYLRFPQDEHEIISEFCQRIFAIEL